MYNRLYDYIAQYDLRNSSQFSFRKGLSTELAILELQDRIINNVDNKEWCIGIFLELSKAFDTLDHKILLSKLSKLGIRGIPLTWFQSNLSSRQQYTQIQSVSSSPQNPSLWGTSGVHFGDATIFSVHQ